MYNLFLNHFLTFLCTPVVNSVCVDFSVDWRHTHTHTERQSPPSTGFPIDYFDVWNVQAWNYRTSAALYSFFSALARTEANGISSFLSFFSDARFCVPSYIILSIWQNNFRFLKSFHLFVSKKHKRGRTVVPHLWEYFTVFSEPRFVRQPAVCSHLPLYKDWEQLFVNMLISERADMQICYLHTERAFLTLTLCCWSIIRKANKHISKCHSGRRLCSFLCRRTAVVTGGDRESRQRKASKLPQKVLRLLPHCHPSPLFIHIFSTFQEMSLFSFFFSSKATFPRAASELRGGNNRSGTWSKASAAAGSKHFYGYFNVFWRVRHESPLFNPAGGRSLILFIPLTSLNILGRRAGSVQCEQIHL